MPSAKNFPATTVSTATLRRLSTTQRELLIEHIDNGLPVRPQQALTRSALMQMGLIRSTKPANMHATRTVLTEKGRQVLGLLLGEYADALVRAGYSLMPSGFLDAQPDETPLQVLERLKKRPVNSTGTAASPSGDHQDDPRP